MSKDDVTYYSRLAINTLFVANPKATSMGVLLGVVLDMLLGLFSPVLKTINYINIASVKLWQLVPLGVLITNLLSSFNKKEIPEQIVATMKFIEEQHEKGNITRAYANKLYKDLILKVTEQVSVDDQDDYLKEFIKNQSKPNANK